MPLFLNGVKIVKIPPDLETFCTTHAQIKENAITLTSATSKVIEGSKLVYVCQREFAIVCPDDDKIDYIGSDDATTCHIVVVRHSGSGVTALAHCDGHQTEEILDSLVSGVLAKSRGAGEGRIEAHLVGGFIDDRKESITLTWDLFRSFISSKEDIHLIDACVTDLNDVIRNETHFPAIYGLAVEVKTGRLLPATFPDKGPDIDIRGALCFAGYKKIHNIYDTEKNELVIGPYNWQVENNMDVYANLPDAYIRKYLSTSPAQEPPHFESHVRTSLKLLLNHPNPQQTLFPNGLPYRYQKANNGDWIKVTAKSDKINTLPGTGEEPEYPMTNMNQNHRGGGDEKFNGTSSFFHESN